MSLTAAQKQAVAARGNVLVVAGAGTGKTRTLVERCLHCLLEEKPPASIEEILMVTFTEAAATEMREKIRGALNRKISELEGSKDSSKDANPEHPPKHHQSAGCLRRRTSGRCTVSA
jgi:ATP-dependent exoDNAse (exonuclease V) beta subunit